MHNVLSFPKMQALENLPTFVVVAQTEKKNISKSGLSRPDITTCIAPRYQLVVGHEDVRVGWYCIREVTTLLRIGFVLVVLQKGPIVHARNSNEVT